MEAGACLSFHAPTLLLGGIFGSLHLQWGGHLRGAVHVASWELFAPGGWVGSVEAGMESGTRLQGCSLFMALPASTACGWVGLGVLQLRVLCFVSNRKYNTIVFM